MKYDINSIFWDLDGTLISPRRRLYKLFCELSNSNLSYDDYWDLKERGNNQAKMLNIVDYRGSNEYFKREWLSNIEREDLLSMDVINKDVIYTLSVLKEKRIRMYVVTNRLNYDNTINELRNMGLYSFFCNVFTTRQQCTKDIIVKRNIQNIENSIFVGDSEEDVVAAKALEVLSILVINKTNSCCESVIPDMVVNDISEILRMVE